MLVFALLHCSAWAETVEKALMPGEVIQGHAKYEQECAKCHQRFDQGAQARLCLDCHKEIAKDVDSKTRFHGRLEDSNCRSCHTEHKGRNAKIVIIDKEKFDHNRTAFALKGGHANGRTKCVDCHLAKAKFRDAPKLCFDCHRKADEHKGSLGRQCESCHNEKTWKEARFDHEKTHFSLLGGKHAEVKCKECHVDKTYQHAPLNCNGCHRKDDQEKGHKGNYGTKCESCHNDKGWKDLVFSHDRDTHYALKGKHRQAKCNSCHVPEKGMLYRQKLPSKCVSCHQKDDDDKGHKGSYGTKCESCHNDKGWKELVFNHDTDTHYALKGKHSQTKCNACHLPEKGPLYRQKLPIKCVSCHRKDDDDKGHRGGLGEKCESCHSERTWKSSSFNHDETHFALHDKHKDAKCETCHKGGVSAANVKLKVDKECVACHRKDDDQKGHKGRYGNKCETCHTAKDWKGSLFSHDRDTKYALKDKHVQTKCDSCHVPEKGGIYKSKLETACIACHKKDDKHKAQLGNKCESCHNEKRWQDAPYDHNKSRYPLTGSHVKTECKKCHQSVAFRDASSTCNGCHEKDDKHKRRFGTKCETCHYTGTWKSWDFDHAKTRFALEGGHKKVDCYDCHKDALGEAGKLGWTCIGCHVKEDVHEGGFGHQCELCHVASSWKKVRR